MFSYSHFETFALFIGALTLGYCTYEEVVKFLAKEPEKPVGKTPIRHQNKRYDTIAQPVAKKALYPRFEFEYKGTKVVKELKSENFKELLSPYFIAVDYLQELWLQHKFNLIITNDLKKYYGKDKALNGFIRYGQIPEIYIKASTSSKHRTAVLIHEIAHDRCMRESKFKKVKIQSHRKEFKRHMKLLFQPLLVDKTYYRKHHELSYHLAYEANRFTLTKDQCA